MKYTKLMRTLSSKNCSKIFSNKLNKAFDEALENGNSELVDANNDLAIATVGNDIVVEDRVNNEVTKFENNPEVEGDMIMEAIEMENDSEFCNATKKCSEEKSEEPVEPKEPKEVEEPKATEEYENTPVVGLESETHEIDTLPEVEVVVNEGVVDDEKSGTIPFSIKFKGVPKDKMYSITTAIKKAFCDEAEAKNIADEIAAEVTNQVNEVINAAVDNAIEEIKTESRRTRRVFSEAKLTDELANDIVDTIVNELTDVVKNEVANAVEKINVVEKVNNTEVENTEVDETKVESEETPANTEEEKVETVENTENETNKVEETLNEVENIKNDIVNNVKDEVIDDVTNDLEKLVNEATIEPVVEISNNEEEKVESKKFSMTADDELSKMLNSKF